MRSIRGRNQFWINIIVLSTIGSYVFLNCFLQTKHIRRFFEKTIFIRNDIIFDVSSIETSRESVAAVEISEQSINEIAQKVLQINFEDKSSIKSPREELPAIKILEKGFSEAAKIAIHDDSVYAAKTVDIIQIPTSEQSANKDALVKNIYSQNINIQSHKLFGLPQLAMNTDNLRKKIPPKSLLKLPKSAPIIVLSLPKSGTKSLHRFFQCSGISSAHYCCSPGANDHPPCYPEGEIASKRKFHACGYCIKKNLDMGQPPFQECGDGFDAFAHIGGEKSGGALYLPQVTAMDEMHKHYPRATFILSVLDTASWVERVNKWFSLSNFFKNTNLPEFNYPKGVLELEEFYTNHTTRVRDFVRANPSHTLIEINIDDDNAGVILGKSLGLNASCWRKAKILKKNNPLTPQIVQPTDISLLPQIQESTRNAQVVKPSRMSELPDISLRSQVTKFIKDTPYAQQSLKITEFTDISAILEQNLNLLTQQNILKLPRPIILLGLPKSGTTSIYKFFQCAGISSSHYCCSPGAIDHPPCSPKGTPSNERNYHLCGYCIKRNIFHGRAPFEGCGDTFDVFAQIDCEMNIWKKDEENNKMVPSNSMYMPQVTELDNLHSHYPNATFILNLRDPASWEKSVRNWFQLASIFQMTDLPEYGYPKGKLALQEFYVNHTKRIRDFAKSHPSHALVEVNIEDEKAGENLAEAFGLSPSCWGQSNENGGRGK